MSDSNVQHANKGGRMAAHENKQDSMGTDSSVKADMSMHNNGQINDGINSTDISSSQVPGSSNMTSTTQPEASFNGFTEFF